MGGIKDFFSKIDKKTLKIVGIGVGVLIIMIVVISILVRLTEKKYYTYEQVEVKLTEASKKYFVTNHNYLPSKEKDTSSVSLNALVVGNYISPLEEILKNGKECTAQVVVTKLQSGYDYTPYLNCGKYYSSKELYNKVLEDNALTSEGIGLYLDNEEKVFKGEVKNNFVMLNEKLWRILRIDEDNNLVLMSYFRTNAFVWDNRYNENTKSNDGINDYNISRLKDSVENEYYNEELLTDSEKSKVLSTKWCLESRKNVDTDSMKNIECSLLTEKESPIGLLTVYEYMQASLDPNCNTLEDRGCTNYNYMHDMQSSFWTITKGQKSTAHAYNVTTSGVYESRTNTSKQVRYVIKLTPKAIYLSGSGIETDPYKIR